MDVYAENKGRLRFSLTWLGHWPRVFADKNIKALPYSPKKIQQHVAYLKVEREKLYLLSGANAEKR